MTRAGKEPAEDLKRRLVAACQEVGLSLTRGRMHLGPDARSRAVLVGASPPAWRSASDLLSVSGIVSVKGDWPAWVTIRCGAADDDAGPAGGVWMKGREQTSLAALVEQLRQTLAEREQVVAAMKSELPGPYRFQQSVWAAVDLLAEAGFL
jgi:hypothetical protein